MSAENPQKQAVCARCGAAIDLADYFVIRDPSSSKCARLCRVEHIVAWVLRGAQWQLDAPWEVEALYRHACGRIQLERHRGGEVLERGFSTAAELQEWATAGGFWAKSGG